MNTSVVSDMAVECKTFRFLVLLITHLLIVSQKKYYRKQPCCVMYFQNIYTTARRWRRALRDDVIDTDIIEGIWWTERLPCESSSRLRTRNWRTSDSETTPSTWPISSMTTSRWTCRLNTDTTAAKNEASRPSFAWQVEVILTWLCAVYALKLFILAI